MRLSISTAIYMTALVLCQDNTEQDEGTCSTTKEECQGDLQHSYHLKAEFLFRPGGGEGEV